MPPATLKSWLENLKSLNADARAEALRVAGPMGGAAIVPLVEMMAGPDKGAARAATQAMHCIAHYSARPGARPYEARAVSIQLLNAARTTGVTRPRMVRSEVLEAVGLIGDKEIVPLLSSLLQDIEVREDARLTLERIPGEESLRSLQAALKQAPADFASALRQSIFNRGLTRATVGAQPMR